MRTITFFEALSGAALLGVGVVTWQGVTSLPSFASGGSYALGGVAGAGGATWRINTSTGDVSICRPIGMEEAPICGPWGQRTLGEYKGGKVAADEARAARKARGEAFLRELDAKAAAEKVGSQPQGPSTNK